jgi:hypothetical protein
MWIIFWMQVSYLHQLVALEFFIEVVIKLDHFHNQGHGH